MISLFVLPFILFFLFELSIFVFPGSPVLLFAVPVWIALGFVYLYRRVSLAALAFLFGSAAVLLMALFPDTVSRQAIAVPATGLVFIFLYFSRSHAVSFPALVSSFSLLTYLGLVFFFLALQIFFSVSLWAVLPSVFTVSFLLFFFSNSAPLELGFWLKFRLAMFSAIAALVLTEWYWIVSQLPIHSMDIDFLAGIVYYTLWDIIHRYFSLEFTRRSMLAAVTVMSAALALVCASAQWLP